MQAMIYAYARAGVDTSEADQGVRAIVEVLRTIDLRSPGAPADRRRALRERARARPVLGDRALPPTASGRS